MSSVNTKVLLKPTFCCLMLLVYVVLIGGKKHNQHGQTGKPEWSHRHTVACCHRGLSCCFTRSDILFEVLLYCSLMFTGLMSLSTFVQNMFGGGVSLTFSSGTNGTQPVIITLFMNCSGLHHFRPSQRMLEQVIKMRSQETLMKAVGCLLFIPALLSATPVEKIKRLTGTPFSIGSAQAHGFLTNSRPKRMVDPRWYRADPNFQSYYRFYSSIGHVEGIYEIDKLRMLYQQMRSLEHTYGPDASSYQNAMGVLTTTAAPTTTTQPPPPLTPLAPTPDPLASAQRIYLCNPKDLLCKPQVVYLPTGAVPVLCDPRSNPACRPRTEEEIKAAAPEEPPAPPPAPKKSAPPPPPPPPPAVTIKGMEYDCDPYWDPDCLIDHPPRPVVEAEVEETAAPETPAEGKVAKEEEVKAEEKAEESAPPAPETEKTGYPFFDPYDFKRDLYDSFAYAMPAAEPEE